MRKKTVLQELVYLPNDLPEVLTNWAISKVKNKHSFFEHIIFELSTGRTYIKLYLEVFGTGLLEEAHLTWAVNDLEKELNKMNELYLLLKEVYGLEPKKPWWRRLI